MKILQVGKFYYPHRGGIERVVQQLAEGMVDRGHEVTVLAAQKQGLGTSEHVAGVPVVRTSSFGTLLSTPLSPTYPFRLREHSDVDIVHVHLPNPLAVASELLIDRTDAPVIATYHSDIVRQERAARFYRPVLRRFLDAVDHIITTSPRLRDGSPVLRAYRDKCTVVPLSVPLAETSDRTVSNPDIDAPGPYVLFVGRLNYYKGVSYLVDAMSEIDATLLVVGDGPRRDALERQARQTDATVAFLGHVDDQTLDRCYATADLFVLPSVEPSEAFGIVQLEAMARGLPVINTNLPTGVPWVSQHGETGRTVEPRDSTALADAIGTLLADDEQRQILSRNARGRVESTFTERRMIESTLELYARVRQSDRD